MRRFLLRLSNLFRGQRAEREMAREIDAHLALMQDDFERRGMTPEAARRAARQSYGGVEQSKELHREARSFLWVEQALQDLRHGARNLLRTPGFTAVAAITLALGIGANTAIFSVVRSVLLEPLAYQEADRLVTLLHSGANPVAPANYRDWKDTSRSFEAMAAAEAWGANLTGVDQPEQIRGLRLTQNLLPMLGVEPLLGRVFAAGEDAPGAADKVILSYGLWQRRFGGRREAVGQTVTLNGQPFTVVGVMPSSFQFAPFWATRTELWAPLVLADRAQSRGGNSLRVFARLRRGVTLDEARAEIATVTARLEQQYPGTNRRVTVTPLKENVVGKVEASLIVMMGAVGFVLLIACANVAHMLLARTADRQREIAVRTAVGAGRARVVRQFLAENLLLAGLGAAAGLLLAIWGRKALVAISPASIPRVETVAIDGHVVLFLLSCTALTSLLFGLVPALQATAGDLSGALKAGGRGESGGIGRNRLRGFLVASEFALTFMLLIGAGLMIRSFTALQAADPGFQPQQVLSMVVSVAGSPEAVPNRRENFYRQLVQQVGALPGVVSASGINHLPLAGDLWGWPFVIEGRPRPRPGESPVGVYRIAMPGYFETMRLPLRRGRSLTEQDDQRAPGVAVINERAAQAYWPGEDPLGKRISFDSNRPQPTWLTVVGVTKNAKQYDWAADAQPEIYLAALQHRDFLGLGGPQIAYLTLVIRTAGDPAKLTAAVKDTVWSFNRNLPVSKVTTMEQAVAEATAQPRFEMQLLGLFGAAALLLAAVGIYDGVMTYSITRRTREIGIRVSLGASRARVLRMVVQEGMAQALAGSVAGLAGAWIVARAMANMLYGVPPTDPATFGTVAAVLGVTALAATWIPARRATRIDPMVALRGE
ncbi:MAG: ABC transporter permease [Bryobacterales bacterium]|nr:ABC transporter permease [Bryobacterales bacterium]